MTARLWDCFADIDERLAAASHILLGLDYDGTLTRIVSDPARAFLSDSSRSALRSIAERNDFSVAVVSGRALDDLRTMVGLDRLIYAGNHGLDICGPGFRFVHSRAVQRCPVIHELAAVLAVRLKGISGAVVEDKALTITVHTRQVSAAQRKEVVDVITAVASTQAGEFQLHRGKRAIEIRPRVDWNKGSALRWVGDAIGAPDALAIIFGDDATDEDAFRAFPEGVTVKVGRAQRTAAAYRVDGPAQVIRCIQRLGAAKVGARSGAQTIKSR